MPATYHRYSDGTPFVHLPAFRPETCVDVALWPYNTVQSLPRPDDRAWAVITVKNQGSMSETAVPLDDLIDAVAALSSLSISEQPRPPQ